MPTIKMGGNSGALDQVCRALEAGAGIPSGNGGDIGWIRTCVDAVNAEHGTDIEYEGENWGYIFSYGMPTSAFVLTDLKEKFDL